MWDRIRKFLGGQTDDGDDLASRQEPRIGPPDPLSRPLPLSDEFNARFSVRKSVPQMLGLEADTMDPLQGMTPMSGHILPGQAARMVGQIPRAIRNKYQSVRPPAILLDKLAKGELAARLRKWLMREQQSAWMKPGALEESERRIGNLLLNERMDAMGNIHPVPAPVLDQPRRILESFKK